MSSYHELIMSSRCLTVCECIENNGEHDDGTIQGKAAGLAGVYAGATDPFSDLEEERNGFVVHRRIICDGCDACPAKKQAALAAGTIKRNGVILGIRYKSAVTQDFDLCSTCEAHWMHVEKPKRLGSDRAAVIPIALLGP